MVLVALLLVLAGCGSAGPVRPASLVDIGAGLQGPAGLKALVTEWARGKVQRVALKKDGSGYKGSVTPFLTGIANPLAIALAPNGSLLVGDWRSGEIYRIGVSST